MGTCKICGREYKNINSHVNTKHKMSIDDYKKEYCNEMPEGVEEVEITEEDLEKEIDNEGKISHKDMIKGIFDIENQDPERPLSSFLNEFDISEKQLRSLVRQYQTGNSIPATEHIEMNQKRGEKEADNLKDKNEVQTTDLFVAECLEREYGFKVTKVISPNNAPSRKKTWVLIKK